MNTGTSGSVSSIRPAETRSIDATRTSTATGTVDRQHDLRQVARERRLERVDAGDRDRCDLGALRPVERRRLIAEPSLDELEPEPCQHVGCGAPADGFEAPGRRRADDGGQDEQRERRRPGRRADVPANARAATWAIRTAWARTSSAASTPSAASAASRARTGPRAAQQARVERRTGS